MYYVHNRDGWEEAKGAKPIKIPSLPEYEFFYTVDNGNYNKYRITEASTGALVSSAPKLKEAVARVEKANKVAFIEKAYEIRRKHGTAPNWKDKEETK